MKRDSLFTFRVNTRERRLIEQLSEKLERNQSELIRWSLRKVAREIEAEARVSESQKQKN